MPGICAAIQGARKGLKTALIHNRGVLGGMQVRKSGFMSVVQLERRSLIFIPEKAELSESC